MLRVVAGVANKPIRLLLVILAAGLIAGTTPTIGIVVKDLITANAEVDAVLHAITNIST